MQQNKIQRIFINKIYKNFQNFHNCGKSGHITLVADDFLEIVVVV